MFHLEKAAQPYIGLIVFVEAFPYFSWVRSLLRKVTKILC